MKIGDVVVSASSGKEYKIVGFRGKVALGKWRMMTLEITFPIKSEEVDHEKPRSGSI